ncbi:MAG: patatin-like phospholipase family protein [Bacteroidales bacterium]|nr:patatin-like phospholipase family protein [Bacteroidales bacterium]
MIFRTIIFIILLTHFCTIKFYGQAERPKIGLVLSGGAAKGIAHIGVLKVLEQAGIKVDYIGGTSMGSIVGGLYALGYDAAALEKITLYQDWNYLLSDEVSLNSISIEEKKEIKKYFLSLPADGFRIKLPGGLISGQNVSLLLSGLIWPYHNVSDFSELPVPFLCIATDIVEGRQVVLDSGYLPDALRASMAIPTVFTPVEIDGKLLVDGGMVNNFPVKEVKEMGADIIIGVDCGFRAFKKEEINTIYSVIEQSLYILSTEKNENKKELCHILIEPDFKESDAINFSNAKELIRIGEEATMQHFDEIKKLADSLNAVFGVSERADFKPELKTYIDYIEIEGLKNVSRNLVLGKLKISTPDFISLGELNTAISRVFGSQFFESVTYKILTTGKGNILRIRVKEKSNMLYRVGGHYDSNFDASILLNATLRNTLIKGSKLTTDLKLGRNPAFEARYMIPTWFRGNKSGSILLPEWNIGWIPDVELLFSYRDYDIYEYLDGRKTAKFDFNNYSIGLSLRSSVTNTAEVGFGLLNEYTRIKPDISYQPGAAILRNSSLNIFAYFEYDSYNEFVFPNRGLRFLSKVEFIKDIDDRQYSDVLRISSRLNKASPLSDKFTFFTNIYGGYILGDSIPPDYLFYSGGLVINDYKTGVFPFTGLHLFELVNKNAFNIGFDLQYEIFKNHYITLRGNIGKTASIFENLFIPEDIYFGYGISYGIRSFIGPVEFSLMANNMYNKPVTYVNIGYWF